MPLTADLLREHFEREGYTIEHGARFDGKDGAAHQVPWLLVKGADRIALDLVVNRGLSEGEVRRFVDAVRESGLSGGILAVARPVGPGVMTLLHAGSNPGVELWNRWRLARVLGDSLLLHDRASPEDAGASAPVALPAPVSPLEPEPAVLAMPAVPAVLAVPAVPAASAAPGPFGGLMSEALPVDASRPVGREGNGSPVEELAEEAPARRPARGPPTAGPFSSLLPAALSLDLGHGDSRRQEPPRAAAPATPASAPPAPRVAPPPPSPAPRPAPKAAAKVAPLPGPFGGLMADALTVDAARPGGPKRDPAEVERTLAKLAAPPPPRPKPAAPAEAPTFLERGVLPAQVEEKAARAAATGRVGRLERLDTILREAVAVSYACTIADGRGGNERIVEGLVVFPPFGGPQHFAGVPVSEPPISATIIPSRGLQVDASVLERAKEEVVRGNTRTQKVERRMGDATISEKVALAPRIDTLRLSAPAVCYVPAFRARGDAGEILVDAITGQVVDASKTPGLWS